MVVVRLLPTKRAAAKKEITVALASGATSVAQFWSVGCMKAKPPPTRTAASAMPGRLWLAAPAP